MSPQSSIGHYRIASKLGEGGMGAVSGETAIHYARQALPFHAHLRQPVP
jgi:hypothetical protein